MTVRIPTQKPDNNKKIVDLDSTSLKKNIHQNQINECECKCILLEPTKIIIVYFIFTKANKD